MRDTVSYMDGIQWINKSVGSEALRNRMEELSNLQLVVCGHIHPGYGMTGKVVNGCLVNPSYEVANKPIIAEVR
jgi:Icc-related predicted phosphoesterase